MIVKCTRPWALPAGLRLHSHATLGFVLAEVLSGGRQFSLSARHGFFDHSVPFRPNLIRNHMRFGENWAALPSDWIYLSLAGGCLGFFLGVDRIVIDAGPVKLEQRAG
jgi:hypothetical protein